MAADYRIFSASKMHARSHNLKARPRRTNDIEKKKRNLKSFEEIGYNPYLLCTYLHL